MKVFYIIENTSIITERYQFNIQLYWSGGQIHVAGIVVRLGK